MTRKMTTLTKMTTLLGATTLLAALALVPACGPDETDGEQTVLRGGTLVEPEDGTRQSQAYWGQCLGSGYAGFCAGGGFCALGKFYSCSAGQHCEHVQQGGGTIADCVGGGSSSWGGDSGNFGSNNWGGGCAGLSYVGKCEGDTAVWCENGTRKQMNCGSSGCYMGVHGVCSNQYCAACGPPTGGSGGGTGVGGAWNNLTGCSGLGWKGKCEGNTAVWCDGGVKRTMNCGSSGCYMGRHGVCGGACCAACGPPANGSC